MPDVWTLDTTRGPARCVVHEPVARTPTGLVLLLHGAGTGTDAAPLPALATFLCGAGLTAVRLDQPYRVAGRRAPDPARLLDAVLLEVVRDLRRRLGDAPLAVIGRSSGARVAVRTAAAAGTRAVAALGFPWQPPGTPARPDRGPELRAGARICPVLVVQGGRDPFGRPPRIRGVRTVLVPGMAHTPTDRAAAVAGRWVVSRLAAQSGPGTPAVGGGVEAP